MCLLVMLQGEGRAGAHTLRRWLSTLEEQQEVQIVAAERWRERVDANET